MHVIAAKAVALREAATEEFRDYQRRVVLNCRVLAARLLAHGFRLVSGGTDNHLALIDLTGMGLTGAEAQECLEQASITVNKNTIPFDPLPATKASGIRIGTPALTTRFMGPDEMNQIADLIAKVLTNPRDDRMIAGVKGEVEALCRRFPLYSDDGNESGRS